MTTPRKAMRVIPADSIRDNTAPVELAYSSEASYLCGLIVKFEGDTWPCNTFNFAKTFQAQRAPPFTTARVL